MSTACGEWATLCRSEWAVWCEGGSAKEIARDSVSKSQSIPPALSRS
jgi:hypothetical protein